jgi:hypothetical protein
MALIWACTTGSMYVSRKRSIKINLLLHAERKRAIRKALLDSGATECFIHPRIADQLQLKRVKLPKPQKVKNVDGTLNQSGEVTKGVILIIKYNRKPQKYLFYVANIREDDLILGYLFLEAANPRMNWTEETIEGTIILLTTKSHQVQLMRSTQPIWLAKTTTATQLAINAASMKKE